MFLRFDRLKAVQAAAIIAAAEGNRIGKLRLLKLLYIAERRAIKETGRPLLGARSVAMDHGPLHSELLNMMNGVLNDTREWNKHFKNVNLREFALRQPSENGTLSRYEIELLKAVVSEHEQFDDWQIVEITHQFPEWVARYKQGTSSEIPMSDIIDAVGRSDDKAAILQDLKDDRAFDKFFAKCEL